MSLLLHIIMTYIKENIITKLQKLYSPPRNPRAGNKSPTLFVKKSPACTIFIERPEPCLLKKSLKTENKLRELEITYQNTIYICIC